MKFRIIITLALLIFVTFGFGTTYSFFQAKSSSTVDQKIARFIFDAKETNSFELDLLDLNPGDNREYEFSVSNTKNNKISHVSMQYEIIIKTYHLVPLKIDLYKLGDKEELIMSCNETYTRNEQNELVCNSKIQELSHKAEKLDNYKLKVSFPEEYNTEEFSGLIDYIDVEIKSWQKI